MSKRLILALTLTVLVASACSSGDADPDLQTGKGARFVPQVVDTQGDIGSSAWANVSADGAPTVSYLGFPDRPAQGEIPETRTIDFPLIPAVLVATADAGAWNYGAVEEQRDALVVKKGDVLEPAPNASAQSAMSEDGSLHVVWVDSEGLWYASGTGGQFGEAVPVDKSGDVFGPSIALDAKGVPWIAYYSGDRVNVAQQDRDGWVTNTVATARGVAKIAPAPRTAITVIGGPVVGFMNRSPMAAVPPATTDASSAWAVTPIEKTGGGFGMALTADKAGNAIASYLRGDGTVVVATSAQGRWTPASAGTSKPSPSPWWTTDVAVDDQGTVWTTWYDSGTDAVRLASGTATGGFVTIDTPGTHSGAMPSVATTPDGSSVWVAWYDHANSNLMAGEYAQQKVQVAVRAPEEVAVTAPAPGAGASAAAPAPAPGSGGTGESAPPESGGGGKAVTLQIAAPVGAVSGGFDTGSLSAPADTPIAIEFDNQDAGVPHNVEVKSADGSSALFTGEIITGPAKATYEMDPLAAGEYPFVCSVHPTTMTGTLTVK